MGKAPGIVHVIGENLLEKIDFSASDRQTAPSPANRFLARTMSPAVLGASGANETQELCALCLETASPIRWILRWRP
jgi:hypothetical protein